MNFMVLEKIASNRIAYFVLTWKKIWCKILLLRTDEKNHWFSTRSLGPDLHKNLFLEFSVQVSFSAIVIFTNFYFSFNF